MQHNISRRLARRREYAAALRHRKENGFCRLNTIIDGAEEYRQLSQKRTELYWRMVFTQPAVDISPRCVQQPSVDDIWWLITLDDISGATFVMSVSLSPGGVTVYQLRVVPLEVLTRIFNVIRWCKKLPAHLLLPVR